jgi:hypothetical protein
MEPIGISNFKEKRLLWAKLRLFWIFSTMRFTFLSLHKLVEISQAEIKPGFTYFHPPSYHLIKLFLTCVQSFNVSLNGEE